MLQRQRDLANGSTPPALFPATWLAAGVTIRLLWKAKNFETTFTSPFV
jgi:hypothetical protein